MNTKHLTFRNLFAAIAMLMLTVAVTQAQSPSAYSNAVMSLQPVAYWPLQESTPPPRYNMETNYGALGPIGNMYYYSTVTYITNFGAFQNDSSLCQYFPGGANKGALVPTTDNRVGLPFTQQFTVEGWVRMATTAGYAGIINETGGQGSGGINDTVNSGGWELVQNFAPYRTATPNSPSVWAFHVFNGTNSTGGADVEVTNNAAGEWLSGNYQNSWVYMAAVFDGTNAWMYIYSTNLASAYGGTNATVYQIPITSGINTAYFGTPNLLPSYTNFVADTWDPILVGQTRSYNGNGNFSGYLQDMAIYTNALSFQQISNHFNAGTNGLGNYQATIAADNPFMHWRMNAPLWTNNVPENTYPVAYNYGSAASTFTNNNSGVSGANSAIYQPGTVPGYPSLTGSGFGPFTNACAFNGLEGVVDVGVAPAINPTDVTNNYSLVLWFKGNPMDALNSRYQCPASHGNLSWKAQIHVGTTWGQTIGSGGSAQIPPNATTHYPNDNKWHMYSLVATYNSGVSTNFTVYLDDGALSATLNYPVGVPGSNTMDAFIGGDPDPQYMLPTNFATFNSGEQEFAGQVAHVAFFTNAVPLSQIANLYFTAEPGIGIVTQPVSASVNEGSAFTNTVLVGGGGISYQWYTNGVAVNGATTASLVFNPVVPADATTNDYVVVQNSYGTITSAVVSLTVYAAPTIQSESPMPYTNQFALFAGVSPSFSISATGKQPLGYYWFTNGVVVGGDTATNFAMTDVRAAFTNYCVVSNSVGVVTNFWSATIIPTNNLPPYPQAVLALKPIAYWPMNDTNLDGLDDGNGDDGFVCHDYINGNDGTYTNADLGNGYGILSYNPGADPLAVGADFGYLATANSDANSILSPDFSTPNGSNAEFSVEAWVYPVTTEGAGGIVGKGLFYEEEFVLDCGNSNAFRFEVRNAAGTVYNANSGVSTLNPSAQSQWYHLVGVCDEANSNISLYINGQLAASAAIPPLSGITNSSGTPISIGARSSSAPPYQFGDDNQQFSGYIDDVAIFNYALTANQIDNQAFPPSFTQQPVSSTNVDLNGELIISAAAVGASPLSYQWYTGGGSPVSGQTNATLVLNNVSAAGSYYLTVSNPYGTTNSITVNVNVTSGAPQIQVQPQSPFYTLAGLSVSNSVSAYGTAPLYYQWQFYNGTSWVNVNNARASGAQSSILTISDTYGSDAGNYQCVVSNADGIATSGAAQLIVLGQPLGFNTLGSGGSGLYWTANGASTFANGLLTLTITNAAENGGTASYFFQIPQYIGGFQASFTYEALYAGSQPMADGTTFCLQDDPRGASAEGSGGGDLAVNTITPSVELELNIFPGNGVGGMGYSLDADGAIGPTTPPGSVILTNVPVDVSVYYANGRMALNFSNEVIGTTFSTNINVGNIETVLGTNTALVGFTGSYGGDYSIQTITNFTFVSIPNEAIAPNGTNEVISWPSSVAGYTLEESTNLTSANWTNVTNVINVVNGQNEVIMPVSSGNMFYRLVLVP